MGVDLADVPRTSHAPDRTTYRRRRSLPSSTSSWSRRQVLSAAATIGTGIGLAALGVFPPARRAQAGYYDIKPLPCPGYASTHNCAPGCGPSALCSDCCLPPAGGCGSGCTCAMYHKNDGVTYKLRQGDCYGAFYGGWVWSFAGTCGCCSSSIYFRCHDGYKKVSGAWSKRICKSVTSCTPCNC